MGYYITLSLHDVKIAESKAMEALLCLQDSDLAEVAKYDPQSTYEKDRWTERLEKAHLNPAEVLRDLLREDDDFDLDEDPEPGFIVLSSWCGGNMEKGRRERRHLKALANLMEAGGIAWVDGEDEEDHWKVSFYGGAFETASRSNNCYVSPADRERVAEAFDKVRENVAPEGNEALETLRQALIRAEFLDRPVVASRT